MYAIRGKAPCRRFIAVRGFEKAAPVFHFQQARPKTDIYAWVSVRCLVPPKQILKQKFKGK